MSDLFTFAESKAAAESSRDRGMSLATEAQERDTLGFKDLAYQALVNLARTQREVHIDDFLRAFPFKPEHPNCFGAVWQRAIRNKIIQHSGRVRKCMVDTAKNAHQYPVYASLVFEVVPGTPFQSVGDVASRVVEKTGNKMARDDGNSTA